MSFDITGLLNEVSNKSNYMEFAMLNYKDIVKNPNNDYTMLDIEEMEESIRNFGILQPIIVKQLENSYVMLIAGERRYTAATNLILAGKVPEGRLDYIPCLLLDKDTPLIIEELIVHETNLQSRPFKKMDEGDRVKVVEKYAELLDEGRKQGLIKGGRTRDIVAKKLDCSPKTVQKYLTKIKQKDNPKTPKSIELKEIGENRIIDALNKTQSRILDIYDNYQVVWEDLETKNKVEAILKQIRELERGSKGENEKKKSIK